MSKTAIIADVQRASVHDGPGLRTTVFLKGCPLRCEWCHNPECISREPETLLYPDKCIGCGRCAEGCYSGARVTCGRVMTSDELLAEILLDKAYYGSCGGVTFSGGEPLLQKEFLLEIVEKCKAEGVSVAVETSLFIYDEKILSSFDLVMADLKIWDNVTHIKYTGVPSDVIKENFKKLDKLSVPIIARTPVIPEIEQGIDKISEFLSGLRNVKKYELLPYHPLGESKRAALGLSPSEFTVPTKDFMKEKSQYVFVRK